MTPQPLFQKLVSSRKILGSFSLDLPLFLHLDAELYPRSNLLGKCFSSCRDSKPRTGTTGKL